MFFSNHRFLFVLSVFISAFKLDFSDFLFILKRRDVCVRQFGLKDTSSSLKMLACLSRTRKNEIISGNAGYEHRKESISLADVRWHRYPCTSCFGSGISYPNSIRVRACLGKQSGHMRTNGSAQLQLAIRQPIDSRDRHESAYSSYPKNLSGFHIRSCTPRPDAAPAKDSFIIQADMGDSHIPNEGFLRFREAHPVRPPQRKLKQATDHAEVSYGTSAP